MSAPGRKSRLLLAAKLERALEALESDRVQIRGADPDDPAFKAAVLAFVEAARRHRAEYPPPPADRDLFEILRDRVEEGGE